MEASWSASRQKLPSLFVVIAWRSVVDGCVLICLLCRVFFKVRANRRVGKSEDPKNRVPEIAVPDLVKTKTHV